jgi:hypothetical protein
MSRRKRREMEKAAKHSDINDDSNQEGALRPTALHGEGAETTDQQQEAAGRRRHGEEERREMKAS